MDKRPLQKIDLVPEWIREALLDSPEQPEQKPAEAQPPTSHEFRVPNLGAAEPAERKISAELYKDPNGQAVVQLVWKGATSPVFEFSKKYSTWKDAEMVFSSLLKELRAVESYVDVDPARAKENVKKLLDEYKAKSDTPHSGGEVGTKTMSVLEIADGWNIVSGQDRLAVAFSDEFLKSALSKFKAVDAAPTTSGEMVYSTASRQHCGADNFVVSFWKKVNTADGNILRNAALVSRIGGSSHFISGITADEYNTLCSALTPNPAHYGLAYDSVTASWNHSSTNVKENLREVVALLIRERMSGTPKELAEYDKLAKGDKAAADKMVDEEVAPKEKEESLPLEPAAESAAPETAPVSEEAPTGDSLDEELADLLKKEAAPVGMCSSCQEGFHGKCTPMSCNCYISACLERKEGEAICTQCQTGGHCKKCACCR